jgi:hypothetical protein
MWKFAFSRRRRRFVSLLPGGLAVMVFSLRLRSGRPDRNTAVDFERGEAVRRIRAAWRRYGCEFGPSAREGE